MVLTMEFAPGPHQWKVSAFTTASPLLECLIFHNQLFDDTCAPVNFSQRTGWLQELLSDNFVLTQKTEINRELKQRPWGGGDCHIWAIQVCAAVKGMVSSSLLWDRVYKSERLGLEQGIIFQETDQLVEDLIQTRDCGITRFCFGQTTVLVTSVVSGKQLFQDRGDLGSLLQYRVAKTFVSDTCQLEVQFLHSLAMVLPKFSSRLSL